MGILGKEVWPVADAVLGEMYTAWSWKRAGPGEVGPHCSRPPIPGLGRAGMVRCETERR